MKKDLIDLSIKKLSNNEVEELFDGAEVELRATPALAATAQLATRSSAPCAKAAGGFATTVIPGIVSHNKDCLG